MIRSRAVSTSLSSLRRLSSCSPQYGPFEFDLSRRTASRSEPTSNSGDWAPRKVVRGNDERKPSARPSDSPFSSRGPAQPSDSHFSNRGPAQPSDSRTGRGPSQMEGNRFANLFERSNNKERNKHGTGNNNRNGFRPFGNDSKGSNHRSKPSRKILRFEINTGSQQAQSAMKDLISQIHASSGSYRVNFVDPQSNKLEQKHLVEVVNSLDLGVNGLQAVLSKTPSSLPLVKLIKAQDMVKSYSDKLAIRREQELLKLGSVAAQRAIQQREKQERKKSATKLMTIAWHISNSDLSNQKRNDINKRLDKDEKFFIYIGDRKTLRSVKRSADKGDGLLQSVGEESNPVDEQNEIEQQASEPVNLDEEDFDIEMRRRELVSENLQSILEECECAYEISGSLQSRLVFKCEPLPSRTAVKKKEEVSQSASSSKELKKQRKLLKQKEQQEKQQQKKIDDDDLDSLYSFKIED